MQLGAATSQVEGAPRGPSRSGSVSRILSRATIHLCDRPGPRRATCKRSGLVLHQVGFTWPPRHRDAGALLPHHFNLAGPRSRTSAALGGVFSVALSRGFPRVGVTDHLALRCPDFPRGPVGPRSCSIRQFKVAGSKGMMIGPHTKPSGRTNTLGMSMYDVVYIDAHGDETPVARGENQKWRTVGVIGGA